MCLRCPWWHHRCEGAKIQCLGLPVSLLVPRTGKVEAVKSLHTRTCTLSLMVLDVLKALAHEKKNAWSDAGYSTAPVYHRVPQLEFSDTSLTDMVTLQT
ncbi:hypothetical protein J0S82_004169 [Galemys pyrenaicus]|uniref:Uncharacterized protein n=1 Tax=Galemys pyrenaicus TaxID=202257 RepID=A0A8J6DTH2_GALPY|nr:hypothetical protein J0S82_004169 [Galemys pyrenaicus]